MAWPTWDEWLSSLDDDARERALNLRDDFARRGASDPEAWARSEIAEGFAQLTRYLLLTGMWRRMHNAVGDALKSDAARSLLEGGADPEQVAALAKQTAYVLAFELCHLLDSPDETTWKEDGAWRSDVEPEDHRWALLEVDPGGAPTGRDVGDLHESLLETDPSGNEGEGWFS